jgi:hypothetical protein
MRAESADLPIPMLHPSPKVASCEFRENSPERLYRFRKNAGSFDLISVRFANGYAALRMTIYRDVEGWREG